MANLSLGQPWNGSHRIVCLECRVLEAKEEAVGYISLLQIGGWDNYILAEAGPLPKHWSESPD